jgi:hypothetical protein
LFQTLIAPFCAAVKKQSISGAYVIACIVSRLALSPLESPIRNLNVIIKTCTSSIALISCCLAFPSFCSLLLLLLFELFDALKLLSYPNISLQSTGASGLLEIFLNTFLICFAFISLPKIERIFSEK